MSNLSKWMICSSFKRNTSHSSCLWLYRQHRGNHCAELCIDSLRSFSKTEVYAIISPILPVTEAQVKRILEDDVASQAVELSLHLELSSWPLFILKFTIQAVGYFYCPEESHVPFGKWTVIPYDWRPVSLKLPMLLCFHLHS